MDLKSTKSSKKNEKVMSDTLNQRPHPRCLAVLPKNLEELVIKFKKQYKEINLKF